MVAVDWSLASGATSNGFGRFDVADLALSLRSAGSVEVLADRLAAIARELGFPYHALAHHGDLARPPQGFVLVQNYPARWVEAYTSSRLDRHDPARRLANERPTSFCWSELSGLLALSDAERRVLVEAPRAGLGEGFTVPLCARGQRAASCSFATEVGQPLPSHVLPAAEYLAHVAFNALFELQHPRRMLSVPHFSPRELECIELAALGKTDEVIGAILGISENTVTGYFKAARARHGVATRMQLVLIAHRHGLITLD